MQLGAESFSSLSNARAAPIGEAMGKETFSGRVPGGVEGKGRGRGVRVLNLFRQTSYHPG